MPVIYIPKSGITGSLGMHIFYHNRSVFQMDCINFLCCVTNYHKLIGLHNTYYLRFCRLAGFSVLGFHKAVIQMSPRGGS